MNRDAPICIRLCEPPDIYWKSPKTRVCAFVLTLPTPASRPMCSPTCTDPGVYLLGNRTRNHPQNQQLGGFLSTDSKPCGIGPPFLCPQLGGHQNHSPHPVPSVCLRGIDSICRADPGANPRHSPGGTFGGNDPNPPSIEKKLSKKRNSFEAVSFLSENDLVKISKPVNQSGDVTKQCKAVTFDFLFFHHHHHPVKEVMNIGCHLRQGLIHAKEILLLFRFLITGFHFFQPAVKRLFSVLPEKGRIRRGIFGIFRQSRNTRKPFNFFFKRFPSGLAPSIPGLFPRLARDGNRGQYRIHHIIRICCSCNTVRRRSAKNSCSSFSSSPGCF